MASINVTDVPWMNTINAEIPTVTPTWIHVMNGLQLTGAIIGILANMVTFVTLTVKGHYFSKTIGMLFKYQSILDCVCCLQASLLFTLPRMWETGNNVLDALICQIWHSQFCYWLSITLSVWNLVTLAHDRYLCVCHPLKYQTVTRRHFRVIILAVGLVAIIFITPVMFLTRRRDGQCTSELHWDGQATMTFFYVYAISYFFFVYAFPCAVFVVLYGLIINRFRQRAKESLGASASPAVIDKASNQLTKTAITVTVFFIVLIGVDPWFCMLGYVGVAEYILNSPLQRVAVFFSVMNSVVNPFIYALCMPLYRKSVEETFLKTCTDA